MIGDKMVEAINKQLNAELYSGYLYVSMSAYFESLDLPGFAHWMRAQAQEELLHAMNFYHYLVDKDARVAVLPIEQPPTEWDSPLAVFQHAYEHEQKISGLINALVERAMSERDFATNVVLQWFVNEQIEEEASAKAVVQQLKRAGASNEALMLLDRELAARVPLFVLPLVPGQAAGAGAP